jgi:hypothetical protein
MRVTTAGALGLSRLELDDGLTVELRDQALVRGIDQTADGIRRIQIDDGAAAIEAPGDRPFPRVVLVSPHAEVLTQTGKTVFTVGPRATRVDVHQGTASLKRLADGQTAELTSRQSLLVGEGSLAARPLRTVLLVQGTQSGRHPTDLLDGALRRHLEGLGFAVELVDETVLAADHLDGKALLVISPSASDAFADRIDQLHLAAAPVPVLCSRPTLFPDLSMVPSDGEARFTANATRLDIVTPEHPLSAGFSGPLQVTRAPGNLGWGRPGPGAVTVATFPDTNKNDRAVIFAYERGAPLARPPARAPARRVGFFIHPDLAPYLTEAGWALFETAVRWAVGDAR